MNLGKLELWLRFREFYREYPTVGFAMDLGRMASASEFLSRMEPIVQHALDATLTKIESLHDKKSADLIERSHTPDWVQKRAAVNQDSYIRQPSDHIDNFIAVLVDAFLYPRSTSIEVEPTVTARVY